MTGLAIRLAQNTSIHRDGTIFNLSPFEVEMRRRLWWQICTLECRAAEAHGSVSLISEENFDAELPLNIDDEEISPEATEFPRAKTSRTDMTFCLAGFVITRTMCRLNYRPVGGDDRTMSKLKTLEEKVKMVEDCRQKVEECSVNNIKSPHLIDWVTITLSNMMIVSKVSIL